MLKIRVWEIPHDEQRYETCGDWWIEPDGEWNIRVSSTGDRRHALLVAVHELVELALCQQRGISQVTVDAFDMAFEQNRDPGDESEPGDDPRAPYRREHQFATEVERQFARELGVNWDDYDRTIVGLAKYDVPVNSNGSA